GNRRAALPARAPASRLPAISEGAGVRCRRPVPPHAHQVGFHGRARRNRRRSARAASRPARCPNRRGHHRTVPSADSPQSAGGRLHRTASVRRVSRLWAFAGLQDGVQRVSGPQFLHGGRGERRGAAAAVLNLLLALASAALLILVFPRFELVWLPLPPPRSPPARL